jgi:hypothetical protein
MLDSLSRLGFEAAGSTPDEFTAIIKSDLETWSRTVQATGFQPLE